MNPAQQATLEALRRPGGGLPEFGRMGLDLQADLMRRLDPFLNQWGSKPLRVTKWHLTGCERRRVRDTSQFAWTPEKAQGTLVHQMIQCWFFDPLERPAELFVRAADQVVRDQSSIGRWVENLTRDEWAEMRLRCESLTAAFVEVFPPLSPSFRPAVEAKQVWQYKALTCECRVDVQLGADEDTAAGVVFVELKTGALREEHLADLEHYALLRALRVGVPPRLLVLFSVAEGRFLAQQVTSEGDLLWKATDRLVDAVAARVSLTEGREPEMLPSPLCRWCEVRADCPAGQAYLQEAQR